MRVMGALGRAAAMVAIVAVALPAQAQTPRKLRLHKPPRPRVPDLLLGRLAGRGVFSIAASASRLLPVDDVVAEPDVDADNADADEAAGPGDGLTVEASDAVDRCRESAEERVREFARSAQIIGVVAVDPFGAGWSVRGMIDIRRSAFGGGRVQPFRCAVLPGGAPLVRIEAEQIAAR